jgi:hypothetical protein
MFIQEVLLAGLKGFVIQRVEPQAVIQVTQQAVITPVIHQAIIKTIMVEVAAKQVKFTNL